MRPLSEKTLTKRYLDAKISESENKLLHRYFLCFSFLYGCIDIKVLWDIFSKLENSISKKKFYDFTDIVQREEHEYGIYDLCDVYKGESSKKTGDKLLINKSLLYTINYKFLFVYDLNDNIDYNNGPYIPTKEELFKYDHDIFYESNEGKAFVEYISNLKTTGISTNKWTNKKSEIIDINNNQTKGKRLKDFIYITSDEQFDIDYYKKRSEELKKKYSVDTATKLLNKIENYIQINDITKSNDNIKMILDDITLLYGVDLSLDEANEFMGLYMNLINSSHRFVNFGWSAKDLIKHRGPIKGPIELRIGDNMKKMIDNGEINLDELKEACKEKDIHISFNNEISFDDLIKENEKLLKEFSKYLEGNNYDDISIDEHINRVDAYINHHLCIGTIRKAECGCSNEVFYFINDFVNEKVIPPDVLNIDLFLSSVSLFYKFMVKKNLVSKNDYDEFIKNINSDKDEMIEDYYEKNPKEIDIDEVKNLIETSNTSGDMYLNIYSKEKIFIPSDEVFGDKEEYDKVDGPNWCCLPHIKDYEIMKDFAYSIDNQNQKNILLDILHNKKAYRRFKDALYDMDLNDEYWAYYDEILYKVASIWMDENLPDINDDFDEEYDTLRS